MRWARSTFVSRIIACLMLVSLLPALVVPDGFAASESAQSPFEQWVRGQLRVPASEAVDSALKAATKARARTIEQFVAAFLEAYDDGAPVSRAFTDRELSEEALISYLQRRFHGVAAEGVLPRHQLVASGTLIGTAPASAVIADHREGRLEFGPAPEQLLRPALILPVSLHVLNPACPQGP